MNSKPMMKCGHAANATDGKTGKPCCVICIGIKPGADIVDDVPSLEGRFAVCSYGNHGKVPSSTNLAFFSHKPNAPFDDYYCGCRGWD
jgi:hypothetical protein